MRPCCTALDVDRHLPVGNFPQFPDLDFKIVRPGPVRVTAGAALVNANRKGAHFCNPLCNLLTQQHATAARFCTLADHDFDRICPAQLVRLHAVT